MLPLWAWTALNGLLSVLLIQVAYNGPENTIRWIDSAPLQLYPLSPVTVICSAIRAPPATIYTQTLKTLPHDTLPHDTPPHDTLPNDILLHDTLPHSKNFTNFTYTTPGPEAKTLQVAVFPARPTGWHAFKETTKDVAAAAWSHLDKFFRRISKPLPAIICGIIRDTIILFLTIMALETGHFLYHYTSPIIFQLYLISRHILTCLHELIATLASDLLLQTLYLLCFWCVALVVYTFQFIGSLFLPGPSHPWINQLKRDYISLDHDFDQLKAVAEALAEDTTAKDEDIKAKDLEIQILKLSQGVPAAETAQDKELISILQKECEKYKRQRDFARKLRDQTIKDLDAMEDERNMLSAESTILSREVEKLRKDLRTANNKLAGREFRIAEKKKSEPVPVPVPAPSSTTNTDTITTTTSSSSAVPLPASVAPDAVPDSVVDTTTTIIDKDIDEQLLMLAEGGEFPFSDHDSSLSECSENEGAQNPDPLPPAAAEAEAEASLEEDIMAALADDDFWAGLEEKPVVANF